MSPTVVLISGANRGLGRGLLGRYLARENHIVVAANRDPEHPTSKALGDLPAGQGSRVVIVKLDAAVESDASVAVEKLGSTILGIDHLDLVIANAAISNVWPKVSELEGSDLNAHFKVNVLRLVWFFQATLPLLRKSANPKWISIDRRICCSRAETLLRSYVSLPNAAYGPTKTAVHWLTKRFDMEEDWLTAVVVHPGWVRTEMGNNAAQGWGLQGALVEIDDSCDGMVKLIDVATKQSHGGKLWDYQGEEQPW
ncbi:NAD(P)-binding protein [Hypoxylon sp. NC1633]|nr:NAD(P)-binding protein [Hypoxylon sp. NC1633]